MIEPVCLNGRYAVQAAGAMKSLSQIPYQWV
jgi:hypothetical protein